MNLFQTVKYGVSCWEAAERYGVSVNRQGKALCPFHNDRHPSLYVADDHYYCFACGVHGDVIGFAANFFGLPIYEAAQRLAANTSWFKGFRDVQMYTTLALLDIRLFALCARGPNTDDFQP